MQPPREPLMQQGTPSPAPPASSSAGPSEAPVSNGTQTPAQGATGLVFPALHLLPLNDTFIPKQIALSPVGTRIKIGRQTNAKTVPNATNGYFDSKVLSRMHAEVWSEDGKVFIKDVKSSNGTFVNGDRLSPESAESEAFELHSEDIVEFGIDIVSDDNKTIVHHKVSTKVHVVITADEALTTVKNLPAMYRMHDAALHRRSSKSGLTFDHVFNRLQAELHKSRETGGELGGLTSTMAEIHDTLGGNVPPPPPSFHASTRGMPASIGLLAKGGDLQGLAVLQAQLSDTQASLAGHIDKMRNLEGLALEHEAIRSEIESLRHQVQLDASKPMPNGRHQTVDDGDDGDDDAASIRSVDTVRAPSPSSTAARSPAESSPAMETLDLQQQNTALLRRIESLTQELHEATSTTRTALDQHASTAEDLRVMAERVERLEGEADAREARWEAWRQQFQASWQQEQRMLHTERDQLRQLVSRWETGRGLHPSSTSDSDASPDSHDGHIPNAVAGLAAGDGASNVSTTDSTMSSGRSRSRSSRRRRSQGRKRKQPPEVDDPGDKAAMSRHTSSDSDTTVASGRLARAAAANGEQGNTDGRIDGIGLWAYMKPSRAGSSQERDGRHIASAAVGTAIVMVGVAYWLASSRD